MQITYLSLDNTRWVIIKEKQITFLYLYINQTHDAVKIFCIDTFNVYLALLNDHHRPFFKT